MFGLLDEFKKFIMRGNVLDMAVGIIIGAAFSKIVSSLVSDILMPPLGLIMGKMDFSNYFINLSDQEVSTLAEAKAAGIPVIAYGQFGNSVIDFLIISFSIFMLIKQANRLIAINKKENPVEESRLCPYCKSEIHKEAVKCPHCASDLSDKM